MPHVVRESSMPWDEASTLSPSMNSLRNTSVMRMYHTSTHKCTPARAHSYSLTLTHHAPSLRPCPSRPPPPSLCDAEGIQGHGLLHTKQHRHHFHLHMTHRNKTDIAPHTGCAFSKHIYEYAHLLFIHVQHNGHLYCSRRKKNTQYKQLPSARTNLLHRKRCLCLQRRQPHGSG